MGCVGCVGAWVPLVVPRLHRQSFGKGNLTLAASRSAVSPWKEQVPVGVNESPRRAAHRRISQLQLRLLLPACLLPTAHSSRPLHAHARCRPPLPTTCEHSPLMMTMMMTQGLPPVFSGLTAEPSTPRRPWEILSNRPGPGCRTRPPSWPPPFSTWRGIVDMAGIAGVAV